MIGSADPCHVYFFHVYISFLVFLIMGRRLVGTEEPLWLFPSKQAGLEAVPVRGSKDFKFSRCEYLPLLILMDGCC